MSTPSTIPQVIDALLAKFAAVSIVAYDGAVTTLTPESRDYVCVGASDPEGEDFAEAASSTQEWAWLGHMQRDETLTVHCVAVSWSPEGNQKATRDSVFTQVQTVTDAIQSDPSFGVSGVLYVVGLTSVTLRQLRGPNGAISLLPFDIQVRSRIN